ncbi:1-phosphofructokinase family hexose kinase [Streptomyces sp. NPDC051976]|uniref:1-phosphofructokinase family hexose kinase n=1 Tax=Streptomyces sp. NPDC051976 TaxID=3154947 RepID=UPI00344456E5
MIVTVTPNPALDITYSLQGLRPHTTHRVSAVHEQAGGKGVNVARVLHALACPVISVLPLGGYTGAAVRDDLESSGINHRAIDLGDRRTRRTIAVADAVDATMLNEPGPEVDAPAWAALHNAVRGLLPGADVLVLSGSLPSGVLSDAYARLITLAHDHGVPVILDADGPALTAALDARPTLIKPNAAELTAATGIEDPLEAATALRKAGAGTVIASLGPEGLLAVAPEGVWRAALASTETVRGNPTGAGDSVVAALATGLTERLSWPEALGRAVALSAATVRAPYAGMFDADAYRAYSSSVQVDAI